MNYVNRASKLANKIEKRFSVFGSDIEIVDDEFTNSRYIFEVKLKRGTKESQFLKCCNDVKLALKLPLFQHFKRGMTSFLAVSEVPIRENGLGKILNSPIIKEGKQKIPYAIGYDPVGEMVIGDLAEMTHLLMAGASNSGKTVALRSLIMSIVCRCLTTQVNLLLFDIGASDLKIFEGIPHLSHPVIEDAEVGINVIMELKTEMDRRIAIKNNDLGEFDKLPAIVVVIDELASFISDISNKRVGKTVVDSISNLLRRGRHAKIHMVLATQDPTLKSIKVDIGNITSRIALKCAKFHESVAITGKGGAEHLQGNGAMLVKIPQYQEYTYVQGAYMTEDTIRVILQRFRSKRYNTRYKFMVSAAVANHENESIHSNMYHARATTVNKSIQDKNKELADVIEWALTQTEVSVLQIQKQFRIGNRASQIMEKLFELGIVGDKFAKLPRTVIPNSKADLSPEVIALLSYTNAPNTPKQPITETIYGNDECEPKVLYRMKMSANYI